MNRIIVSHCKEHGLVASILILQPLAVVVVSGPGIHPFPVLLIMCSFGTSIIFGLFGKGDLFF
ncbi:MAG: hypothetical protein M0Q91_00280 [Methanoregula sp.]|nr:hypothetical protein [Methanoregula sp.]